ncbi:GNAT family N-acetyltransferase [Undibacterium sp.]|jgi:ribosomal-protein-alanine N-acetyltransferase|uniref:GNAT family N-acetyltransferase n=1 Tax=Undibacterium sp. TaxID=1914977 RepID=UPI002BC301AF|nr:GNAT family N-acetyltransferase [Undibacterium sp.]HTD03620.1 GNAT family N-acetyltransferase [Undibacterium sp.]
MQLNLLQQRDAEQLLQFESANRAWFDQFIEDRGDWFYTREGMRAHIADFHEKYAAGSLYPCLVLDDDGHIVGRVNLRDIERQSGTARLGYRVAAHCAGRGVASAAVIQVLEIARVHLHLQQLIAHVSVENLASIRVLEKSGFARTGMRDRKSVVQGRALECHEYLYSFDA